MPPIAFAFDSDSTKTEYLYYKNGNKMSEASLKNGMLNGKYAAFYESGAVKEKGKYLNNLQSGKCLEFVVL
ncbi:MAG: hypothetical protein PHE56_06620 [Bacteroidales bacterium]|nr:hypothetical protein [Bacteroidales bacterium]